MICNDCNDMAIVKIPIPAKQHLLNSKKFLLVCGIADVSVVELSALICNRVELAVIPLLKEATPNCEI